MCLSIAAADNLPCSSIYSTSDITPQQNIMGFHNVVISQTKWRGLTSPSIALEIC